MEQAGFKVGDWVKPSEDEGEWGEIYDIIDDIEGDKIGRIVAIGKYYDYGVEWPGLKGRGHNLNGEINNRCGYWVEGREIERTYHYDETWL